MSRVPSFSVLSNIPGYSVVKFVPVVLTHFCLLVTLLQASVQRFLCASMSFYFSEINAQEFSVLLAFSVKELPNC